MESEHLDPNGAEFSEECLSKRVGEGDRVAVRWQLTAMYDGRPFEQSLMAIYRFEEGRIAEDWGFGIRELWP